MNGKKGIVLIAVLFAALLGGAFFLYGGLTDRYDPGQLTETDSSEMTSENEKTEQEEKMLAPDFTVYDAEGNAVNLSDLYGKPLVINFWATWCGFCQMHMPLFQQAYEEYGDEINFVMVNMTDGQRDTVEKASGYIAENGYTFPVYYDTDMDAAATYGVRSLPITYFADSDGHLVIYGSGALTEDMMAQGIGMIYSE